MAIFKPRKFNKAIKNYLYSVFFTNATTQVEDPEFTGSGLNDLSSGGTYVVIVDANGNEKNLQYTIVITATDTFKWKENYTDTWTTGVTITGGWQILSNGVQIQFENTTGYTVDDQWTVMAAYATAIKVYIAQSVHEALFSNLQPPCYVVVSGEQEHIKTDDCKVAYRPMIIALAPVMSVEQMSEGKNPITKYITVDDMTSNLKPYVKMDSTFRTNMKTYGFDQRIVSGMWTGIPPPEYVENDKFKQISQAIQLKYEIM